MTDQIDEPLQLWDFYRDKYGPEDALSGYFPSLVASDPVLSHAIAMIAVARQAIIARMAELEEHE